MSTVLGISVSSKTVLGVLVENGSDGPSIIRTIVRPRSQTPYADIEAGQEIEAPMPAPEKLEDDADFGVHFTQEPEGDSDLFLAGEFGVGEPSGVDSKSSQAAAGVAIQGVEIEIKEILAECEEAGYSEIRIAFCLGMPDLHVRELAVDLVNKDGASENNENGKKGSSKSKSQKAKKGKLDLPAIARKFKRRGRGQDVDRLARMLSKQLEHKVDPGSCVFLPMTPQDDGGRRVLAVTAKQDEPIEPTLRRFVHRGREMPRFELVETEVSLLLGLARGAAEAAGGDGTEASRLVLLRVGAEESIVLFFLVDGRLQYYETLRSITEYDPPETIGSRLLLLQDEYGLGESDQILVLSEHRDADLVKVLAEFFPESSVRSVRPMLPTFKDELDRDTSPEATLAAAAALRALTDRDGKAWFEPVNLIPPGLLKRSKLDLPTAWQNYAMFALLFGSTLFFVARYLGQKHDLDMTRLRLEQYSPETLAMSKAELEAHIDSIQTEAGAFFQALNLLDSLLLGSDRWSRAMERTASQAAAVSGVWIENWNDGGDHVTVSGNAADRNQIVRLAARMDGVIESITFSSIREWPVFSFSMSVPLQNQLPEAAIYLREQLNAVAAEQAVSAEAVDTTPSTTDQVTSSE